MTFSTEQANQIIESAPLTIIEVTDAEKGKFTERLLAPPAQQAVDEAAIPYPRDHRGRMTINEQDIFMEVASGRATTRNFGDVLRMGVEFDVFSGYSGTPVVWPMLTGGETPSNKQQEEYLKDAAIGIAPIVGEGEDYPEAAMALGDGVIIRNHKRGYKLPVTEEMRMFDQLGKVRDLANSFGRSLRITEDYAVIAEVTTAGNYTRTEAAGDNDQGNNTATLTLSASGLETAVNTLVTMKDRKSGVYLGVRPTLMWCSPKALIHAKRLIQVATNVRVHGATTAEVDGTGQLNPFFGLVGTIISSPWFGKEFEWGLLDPTRALKFQRVMPVQVRGPEYDMDNDTYWYYPRTFFGTGFKDDRFAFFSDSTTRPTVS